MQRHKVNKEPDIKSSFEYRDEIILVEWHEVDNVEQLPDIDWEQVYAIGNVNNKVPIVHYAGDGKDNLPGGKFENNETIEQTLHREIQEELNMKVLAWSPVGYQKLINKKFGTAYQLRVYAELEPLGKFIEDPGGGVIGHSLVPIDLLNQYIQYGDVGDRMVELVRESFADK